MEDGCTCGFCPLPAGSSRGPDKADDGQTVSRSLLARAGCLPSQIEKMAQTSDADRQIRQMVEFIRLEAKEKAAEIRAKAKADADVEKQMAVVNAKAKIGEEFDRKEKAQAVEQKIAASMAESKQRSRLLGARDAFVQKLHAEAKARLASVASSNTQAYNVLLKGLIKQAIESLEGETSVEVHCRPQDLAIAQKAAIAACQEIAAEAKAAGGSRNVTATVAADPALGTSAGGVFAQGAAGRIKVNNTLEARLDLAFDDLTPVVRDLLYPSARAEVRVKPKPYFPHLEHAAAQAAAHPKPAAPAPKPAPAPIAAPAGNHPTLDPYGQFSKPAAAPAPAAADPFAL